MFTRKQRLNNECTHEQYYAQFITEEFTRRVVDYVGIERLMSSKDPHFNDIPLKLWDNAPRIRLTEAQKMRDCGDYLTLAGIVCLAKCAARSYIKRPAVQAMFGVPRI